MSENHIQNHWIVITNPRAGKRKLPVQRKFILSELKKARISHTFIETEYAGHAIKIARENAEKGYQNFLVLGGDGSISEVINGIFSADIQDTSNIKIALIPRGTGNDWGRFWKLKKDDKHSFSVFLEGKTRLIDIGKIFYRADNEDKNHYFINSVGFGLDAKVADLTHTLKKYVGSFSLLYTLALLIAVFRYKSTPAQVKIDNQEKNIALFTMNIANGPYSGGGIKQNPDAVPYDGIFDMILVEKPTLKEILSVLPHIFSGKITRFPIVQSFKAQEISIHSQDTGLFAEADGIVLKNTGQSQISILPDAIQMIMP